MPRLGIEAVALRKKNKLCVNCCCPNEKKPQIFRDEDWCSDLCRKALAAVGLAEAIK